MAGLRYEHLEKWGMKNSSLYDAIELSGDIDSLRQLLVITAPKQDEVDVHNNLLRQTHFNNNSLHVAVQLSNSVTLVEEILNQCGSSKSLEMLMQQNMNGNTPLHIAAKSGSTEIVSLFLDHARKFQVIEKDEDCYNIDVEKGMILPIEKKGKGVFLTESVPAAEENATKTNVEKLVRIANKKNNTALHEVLQYRTYSGIPQLLINADPGFEYFSNDSGETPLYLAARCQDNGLVEHMLKTCPSQSYGGPGGRTALHALAAQPLGSYKGSLTEIVHLLSHLLKEVDKNGRTALHYAAYFPNVGFVEAVMKVDPSICYLYDKDGMTALHHAAKHRGDQSIEVMKTIFEYCMDCWEVLNNDGRNFLHVAALNFNSYPLTFVVRDISPDLVVEAILSMKDKHGKTPCEITRWFPVVLRLYNQRIKRRTWDKEKLKSCEDVFMSQSEEARKAAGDQEKDERIAQQIEYHNQTLVVVSALIATVAFAANFTLPGGYNSDGPHKGMALLANKPSFILFILSNSMAMVLSALAIFIHFFGRVIAVYVSDNRVISIQKNGKLLTVTLICTLLAIYAMMAAFVTGAFAGLSHLPGLAISVCLLGCVFFFLSFYVIYKTMNWLDEEVYRRDKINWS